MYFKYYHIIAATKPIQTEATSTISQIVPAETNNNNKTIGMPPLKPLGNQSKVTPATVTTTPAATESLPDELVETIQQVNGSGDAQEKPVTAEGDDVR